MGKTKNGAKSGFFTLLKFEPMMMPLCSVIKLSMFKTVSDVFKVTYDPNQNTRVVGGCLL